MPSIEDADDFADWMLTKGEDSLQSLSRYLENHRTPRGARPTIAARAERIRQALFESRDDAEARPLTPAEARQLSLPYPDPLATSTSAAGAEAPAMETASVAEAFDGTLASCYAVNLEEAQAFGETLREESIPYAIDVDNGLYRVMVQQENMENASLGAKALFEVCTLENVEGLLAVQAACSMAAPDVEELDFVPGSPDNATFYFETVSWDRQASMVTQALDELGIAYQAEAMGDELVRFELSGEHAADVKEMAEALCSNVNGMKAARFSFPESFEASAAKASEDKSFFRTRALAAEEAHVAVANLQSIGVEFDAVTDRETGATFITMDSDACRSAIAALEAGEGPQGPLPSLSEAAELSKEYSRKAAAPNKRADAALREARRQDTARRHDQTTPVADERHARESAKAQAQGAQRSPRRQRQSRGQGAA